MRLEAGELKSAPSPPPPPSNSRIFIPFPISRVFPEASEFEVFLWRFSPARSIFPGAFQVHRTALVIMARSIRFSEILRRLNEPGRGAGFPRIIRGLIKVPLITMAE